MIPAFLVLSSFQPQHEVKIDTPPSVFEYS